MSDSGFLGRDTVTAGYDELGERYGAWTRANDPTFRSECIHQLRVGLPTGARVVELGCGPGSEEVDALAAEHRYVGVDRSSVQLALAATALPSARLVLGDIATVAFAPASIDAVCAFYSIIHVPREDHASIFRHIAEWLRPGGIFVASLGARDNPGAFEEWVDGVRMYWSFYDAATNERLLEDAGFVLERSEVLTNFEDGREAKFHWVRAVAPGRP